MAGEVVSNALAEEQSVLGKALTEASWSQVIRPRANNVDVHADILGKTTDTRNRASNLYQELAIERLRAARTGKQSIPVCRAIMALAANRCVLESEVQAPTPSRPLYFLEDTPLVPRVWMDRRFEHLANRLVQRLEAAPTDAGAGFDDGFSLKPPFTCAIYGPWGTGKTSFLNAIRAAYEGSPGRKYVTVFFEPWRFEDEKHLIIPLLSEISKAVVRYHAQTDSPEAKRLRQAAVETAKKLLGTLAKDVLRTASGVIEKQSGFDAYRWGSELVKAYVGSGDGTMPYDSEIESFRLKLRELLRSARPAKQKSGEILPIIVFIDDLDRCGIEQTRRLLESMKLFLNENGVHYFMALDEEQVLRALSSPYISNSGDSNGNNKPHAIARRYLEKFFQHTIDLGAATSPLHDYVPELRRGLWSELRQAFEGRRTDEPLGESTQDRAAPGFRPWLENPILRLACGELFWCVKPNPRALKAAARWLYFNIPSVYVSDAPELFESDRNDVTKKVVGAFAEVVISVNFGSLWTNELSHLPSDERLNCYRIICEGFEEIGLAWLLIAFPAERGADLVTAVLSDAEQEAHTQYVGLLKQRLDALRQVVVALRNRSALTKMPDPAERGIWQNTLNSMNELSERSGLLSELSQMASAGQVTALRNLYVAAKLARAASEMPT